MIECNLLKAGFKKKPNEVTLQMLQQFSIPNLEKLTEVDLEQYRTIGRCILVEVKNGTYACEYFLGTPNLTYKQRKEEHGFSRNEEMLDRTDVTDRCPIPKYVRKALR